MPATPDAPAVDAPIPVDGAIDAAAIPPPPVLTGTELFVKASNTGGGDQFGASVALASDGHTLAIGAPAEASAATGIDGDQTDNTTPTAGAVYVFAASGATWTQQAYVKASNTGTRDELGAAVALAADGNTLAIGAPREASCATGVDGDQTSNDCNNAGAVFVFVRTGATWAQQAYLKPEHAPQATDSGEFFGATVALSADGDTVAVGAAGDCSAARGIDGDSTCSIAGTTSGAVYVFHRSAGAWTQQAYVKSSNSDEHDTFGTSVALSGDGSLLAAGAVAEASSASGVNGSQLDNSLFEAGAAYLFTRTGATWAQIAYVKASNPGHGYHFGNTVALAADGHTLAVGALDEASGATGIDGDQTDQSQLGAGAVYLFADAGGWAQQAYIKEQRAITGDHFSASLALSTAGDVLVVGGPNENSSGVGVTSLPPLMPFVAQSGVVYRFGRAGTTWAQLDYVKASNPREADVFGSAIALSGDGATVVVGAPRQDGAATGVGGEQNSTSAVDSGAAYVVQ